MRQPLLIKSEKGSAMLITLLVVTLMISLGVVLLSVVSQGMKTSAAGEARIMAEALAQKGLDEATAAVHSAVAYANANEPDYRLRAELLERHLVGASGRTGLLATLPGSFPGAKRNQSYEVKAVSSRVTDLKATPSGKAAMYPDYPYVRKITVQSTGVVGMNPPVKVAKSRVMYVNSINPVMRYAVSANVDDASLALPAGSAGRTALALNGAVYTVGDMYVHGDLKISDRATFLKEPGVTGGVATGLPALRGFYQATGDVIKSSGRVFDASSLPVRDTSLEKAERVDVKAIVGTIMGRHAGGCSGLCAAPAEPVESPEWIAAPEEKGWRHYDQVWLQVNGATVIKGNGAGQPSDVLLTNSLLSMSPGSKLTIQGGSLTVDYPDPELVVADLQGTVALDEGKLLAVNGNAVIGDGFRLQSGNIFIRGDLKVYGNINLFGTVYVDGNVELRDIRSINKGCTVPSGGSCPPLVIAASGSIEMGEYIHDTDTEIAAYLYANQAVKLYGVYSKLNLVGGIHADKGLELNAVLGGLTSIPGAKELDPVWLRYAIRSQTGLKPEDSRLRIAHDINLYDNPPAGIPLSRYFNLYISHTTYEAGQEAP
jgi:hypothetical protein